jgi:hypothetical protein
MSILDDEKIKLMCTVIGCGEPHGRDCKLFNGCSTLERLIAKGYELDTTAIISQTVENMNKRGNV